MHNKLWTGLIAGGLLLAGTGWQVGADMAADTAPAQMVVALMLLTAGLTSLLAGLVGASGMLAWIPGIAPHVVLAPDGSAKKNELMYESVQNY